MGKELKSSKELDDLKMAYENAMQVRKHAKSALKTEKKAVKMHLKPFRLAYKQAVQVEKETKELLKLLQKADMQPDELKKEKTKKKKSTKDDSKKGKKSKDKSKEQKPKDVKKEVTIEPAKIEVKTAPAVAKGQIDDLTKVKGVGEKVAEMLHANGIKTYTDMAATPVERFRTLLRKNNMSKFRNPTNWAKAAAVLAESPPVKTTTARKSRKTTVAKAPAPTKKKSVGRPKKVATKPEPAVKKTAKPKTAKVTAKAASGGDDLTSIKGVGVAVAAMLNKNGIVTFEDMAATSVERFRTLLRENNMSKYRNPTNWAKIATEKAKSKT